jgi:hypothetical protein
MTRRARRAASLVAALCAAPASAAAQTPPSSDGIAVGAFTFRPLAEVRVRGEGRNSPFDTGGAVYGSTATLSDGYGTNVPTVVDVKAPVYAQWLVGERARLGLAVDRGPVTAAVTLQDARVLGNMDTALLGPGQAALPSLAPWEAYIDVHSRSGRRTFFRLGRQKVTWGDGRLVGENDWSPTARSLDAARFGVQLGDLDVEAMAALLAAPGAMPPSVTGTRTPSPQGTGAQLYGIDAVWHLWPLFNLEGTGLARIVREPSPMWLTPGDTYVGDGRLFGDYRGFRYALEGAYEGGRLATFGGNRTLSAFAAAAKIALETALPGHLTFGAQADYASGGGDGKDIHATETRFDPILPDEHRNLGMMDVYSWSNLIELGGDVAVRPADELRLDVGYRLVGLASPEGRWTTGSLQPVGASATNSSRLLGHEVDVSADWTPWEPITFSAGYGLFLLGDAAKAILTEAKRDVPDAQHWGFLQTVVRVP